MGTGVSVFGCQGILWKEGDFLRAGENKRFLRRGNARGRCFYTAGASHILDFFPYDIDRIVPEHGRAAGGWFLCCFAGSGGFGVLKGEGII